jgi:bifunctional isochorismate lyase/aryl carrier protein
MALPKIAAYPLPRAEELPENRVDWTPDPARALLLVHDLQNHFLDVFPPDTAPVAPMLANVRTLRDAAHRLGVPVAYSLQRGGQSPEERGLQQDFWGPGLPGGDPRAVAVPAVVAPTARDTLLTKWKYSAFVRTGLAELIREQGRDQLIVVGVYAHIGVLLSAADAWMRDIQAFLVADAVADFSAEDHAMALRYAAGRCARVATTAQLLDDLDGLGGLDAADDRNRPQEHAA